MPKRAWINILDENRHNNHLVSTKKYTIFQEGIDDKDIINIVKNISYSVRIFTSDSEDFCGKLKVDDEVFKVPGDWDSKQIEKHIEATLKEVVKNQVSKYNCKYYEILEQNPSKNTILVGYIGDEKIFDTVIKSKCDNKERRKCYENISSNMTTTTAGNQVIQGKIVDLAITGFAAETYFGYTDSTTSDIAKNKTGETVSEELKEEKK